MEIVIESVILSVTEVINTKRKLKTQKQPSRGVFSKRYSENMQQICRRTPMSKCDFNKVAKHGCSTVNLQHIFRTPFTKNTSERLLLKTQIVALRLSANLLL